MEKNENYRFSKSDNIYIIFDLEGYVIEVKGFGKLMWSTSLDIDKELVGKHVDEIAKMLEKHGGIKQYYDFEVNVHIPLLKQILEQKENKS